MLAFPGAQHGKSINYAVLKMVVGAPEGSFTFSGGLVLYSFSGLRGVRVKPEEMPVKSSQVKLVLSTPVHDFAQ